MRLPLTIIGLLVALAASGFGVINYEHIDISFWKILMVTIYPVLSAYFITWHVVFNRHKKKRNPEYSMVPGTVLALIAAGFAALPFSGILLLINDLGKIESRTEKVVLETVFTSMKYGWVSSIKVKSLEKPGEFKFKPNPDMGPDFNSGSRYWLKYKTGLLGIAYLDSDSKLDVIPE